MSPITVLEIALLAIAVAAFVACRRDARAVRRAIDHARASAGRAEKALIEMECMRADMHAHIAALASMVANAHAEPTRPAELGGDTVPSALFEARL